ncbi:MAG TPA: HAD-IIB family hydrolase [Calditrichaeota bacterium]|nr:HAD-IIB family hydrolase [Calditrichota bacterium]
MHWLVFTDLDGTLLDSKTYSFTEAEDAISFMKEKGIPLIPCTSKTHEEVVVLREKIGINDPFISENGSAIFIEKSYFSDSIPSLEEKNGFGMVVLGKRYGEVIDFLAELKENFALSARGFHEMEVKEIVGLTGLTPKESALAKQRSFSEPFILLEDEQQKLAELLPIIEKRGFRLLRGNRFYHLLGQSDKGVALRYLKNLFEKYGTGKIYKTVAVGDSLNDLEMLKAADIPILVKKADGRYQQDIDLPNLIYSEDIGPRGFAQSVLSIIKEEKT